MMNQKENFYRFYLTEADPWYTGNFDITYDDVCTGCDAFIEYIRQEYKL